MDDTARDEFRDFVMTHGRGLMRLAYLLTQDRHLAEDLVQTALLRAYRNWARVSGAERPEAYVHRILVNERRTWWRRKRIDERPYADLPDREVPDASAGVDARDALWRELSRLPARVRAVLVLRYWEDYSEADTAAILGCSVGTVKSHASRGLARLRQHLALPDDSADQGSPVANIALKGTRQ